VEGKGRSHGLATNKNGVNVSMAVLIIAVAVVAFAYIFNSTVLLYCCHKCRNFATFQSRAIYMVVSPTRLNADSQGMKSKEG
jgi:hypothetical protein